MNSKLYLMSIEALATYKSYIDTESLVLTMNHTNIDGSIESYSSPRPYLDGIHLNPRRVKLSAVRDPIPLARNKNLSAASSWMNPTTIRKASSLRGPMAKLVELRVGFSPHLETKRRYIFPPVCSPPLPLLSVTGQIVTARVYRKKHLILPQRE